METKDFKKKFMKASPDIDRSLTFNRIVRRDIKRLGETMCNIIAMEELSELSKEISKELRGKGDNTNILEELADVQLGIYYVQEICKINNEDLHKAMNVKMKRLEDVLIENGKYK